MIMYMCRIFVGLMWTKLSALRKVMLVPDESYQILEVTVIEDIDERVCS